MIKLVFFLVFTFSTQVTLAIETEPDVIFQRDVDQKTSRLEIYPIKLCISILSYSPMAAKIDASKCRQRSDISYDECMNIGKKGRDFSQLIVNKKFKAKTGDVIYLKKNIKYSFFTGSGGIVKDFTKESKSIFLLGTANYGGVALDPVKSCH